LKTGGSLTTAGDANDDNGDNDANGATHQRASQL
jgi:hypothetical protein